MKKGLAFFMVVAAVVCLAVSIGMSMKVSSLPYRLNYEQGRMLDRTRAFWAVSAAVTGLAGLVLVSRGKNRLERGIGLGCIFWAPVLFLFVPNFVHSITSAKNACINNLR